MYEVFTPGPYFNMELLSLLKYTSVYFCADIMLIYFGPTVWLFGGLFLMTLLLLNILQDMVDITDGEKSYGYAIQERKTRNWAVSVGLGIGVIVLCIFAVIPTTFKQGELDIERKNATDSIPHITYHGFTNPVYDSDGRYIPGISGAKLGVHFAIDFTKMGLLRYVVTKVQLMVLQSIQFYRKLV